MAGCGGGDDSTTSEGESGGGGGSSAAAWLDPDGEPPVVGSLVVSEPGSETLWLSTNRGLYRVREGARPSQVTGSLSTPLGSGRVSAQLVVTVVDGELLASGHPASDSSLPQVLGLIRSSDEGRTWQSVSELGSADFHVLRPSRDRLVAASYGEAQVKVSADGGKTWQTRAAPRPLVDLAVDPGDPDRWVGTTQDGVYASTDGGGSWRQVDVVPNVRLAWATPDVLYRVDPGGPVQKSSDGGRTWARLGSTGGEPQALTADGASTLYVALLDGGIKRSTDGGESWTEFIAGGPS